MTAADFRSSCLDAETLAAWAEGGLTRAEVAGVEAHAAGCPRCQAMLAAMVRTDPAPADVPVRSWRRLLAPVLVPVTALTVFAIWLAVPREEPVLPRAQPEVLRDRPAAAEPSPAAPPVASSAPERFDAPAGAQAPKLEAKAQARARQRAEEDEALESRRGIPREAVPAAPPPPPAAAPAPQSANERLAEEEAVRSRTTMADSLARISALPWRLAGGRLQRSPDGGATWRDAPDLPGNLTALSSPGGTVWWAVGRAGVVLLTENGITWRRLNFPEAADLAGVSPVDAATASVTTADGRVFRTQNAGSTWDLMPAQEFPASPF